MQEPLLRVCTAYMPPLDYFAALVKAGRFTVDIQETYRKQTFRNRMLIVTSQGVQMLSVPCVKISGNHTPVAQIAVSGHGNWQRDHWRSIVTAYNKSPFFLYYSDELKFFFERPWATLAELNTALTDFLIAKLRLPAERIPSVSEAVSGSEIHTGGESGSIMGISDRPDTGSAGKYLPPLDFTPKTAPKYDFDPYLQTFPCAQARGHLSILDLLFNVGPEASLYLQTAREL